MLAEKKQSIKFAVHSVDNQGDCEYCEKSTGGQQRSIRPERARAGIEFLRGADGGAL